MVTFKKVATFVFAGMLVFSLAIVTGCASKPQQPAAQASASGSADPTMADRTFVDAAGRSLTVPGIGALKKIYYTGASAEIFCITLAPDLAGGTTYDSFSDADYALLPAGMRDLEFLGTTSGQKQLNLEAIMASGIQLIISIPFAAPTDQDVSDADNLQKQTGIPVILLDGSFEMIPETYKLLGSLLGREDEAQKFIDYYNTVTSDVAAAVAKIPESEQVSVYYAEGNEGLQTEPSTSPHGLIFNLAGARNVAQVDANGGAGMSDVSMEQVLAWDPEVIVVWSQQIRGGADELIRSSNLWAPVTAVQNGRVYTMPNTPFSWIDRPPAVNRLLGLQWVTNMLYPDAYDVDMVEVTKEFYSLFYHVDMTDDQAKELLGNSYPVFRDR